MGLKDLQQSFSQAWALKDPPRKAEGFPKILQLQSSRGLKDSKELKGPTHGLEGFAIILQPGVGPEGPTPQGLKAFQKSFSFNRRGV